jgi:antitoxin VapB
MAFHIRDTETNDAVRKLAAITGLSLTEAVRQAAKAELARLKAVEATKDRRPFLEKIKDIQDQLAAYPRTGFKADKEFYDGLSDE